MEDPTCDEEMLARELCTLLTHIATKLTNAGGAFLHIQESLRTFAKEVGEFAEGRAQKPKVDVHIQLTKQSTCKREDGQAEKKRLPLTTYSPLALATVPTSKLCGEERDGRRCCLPFGHSKKGNVCCWNDDAFVRNHANGKTDRSELQKEWAKDLAFHICGLINHCPVHPECIGGCHVSTNDRGIKDIQSMQAFNLQKNGEYFRGRDGQNLCRKQGGATLGQVKKGDVANWPVLKQLSQILLDFMENFPEECKFTARYFRFRTAQATNEDIEAMTEAIVRSAAAKDSPPNVLLAAAQSLGQDGGAKEDTEAMQPGSESSERDVEAGAPPTMPVSPEGIATVNALFAAYSPRYAPEAWVKEPAELAKLDWGAVRVYHNSADDIAQVELVATQREPTNIAMERLYDADKLEALAGYRWGAYGLSTPERLMPNIAIYCVTPVVQGGKRLDRVHVINLIGYAFDSRHQPDMAYFGGGLKDKKRQPLNTEALKLAYAKMWAYAFAAALQHGLTCIQAFGVGSGAFRPDCVGEAAFLRDYVDGAIEVARGMVPHAEGIAVRRDDGFFIPNGLFAASAEDIATTLYVNAWDPWSMVGNGNARDRSLDGYWGRSTAMAPLCWPKTNPAISYEAVQMQGAGSTTPQEGEAMQATLMPSPNVVPPAVAMSGSQGGGAGPSTTLSQQAAHVLVGLLDLHHDDLALDDSAAEEEEEEEEEAEKGTAEAAAADHPTQEKAETARKMSQQKGATEEKAETARKMPQQKGATRSKKQASLSTITPF